MWWLQPSSSGKPVPSIHQHLVQRLAPPLFFLHQDLIVRLQAAMAIFTRTSVGCLETQAVELEVYMDLLPLWGWQYSGIAISWSCCGCNWCCSVAATEVEGMSTTEASPLIGPARGHGMLCTPKNLQPDQVSGVSSDIRLPTRGAKLCHCCRTAIYFRILGFPPPANQTRFTPFVMVRQWEESRCKNIHTEQSVRYGRVIFVLNDSKSCTDGIFLPKPFGLWPQSTITDNYCFICRTWLQGSRW